MTRTRRLICLLRIAAVLGVLVASRATADARRDYLDGVRAYREGRWSEAVDALEKAAAERPREEARARLVGAIPEPYLPWHYLGLAFARLGQCDRATAAWQRSSADGVAERLPERATERATLEPLCNPSPTRTDPIAIEEAPELAREEPSAEEQVQEQVQEQVPEQVPGTFPNPTPTPERKVAGTVSSTAGTVSRVVLSGALVEGGDRFSEGDYGGTMTALAPLRAATRATRERALADLLAAAASFALYELGGRADPELLRHAEQAADRARADAQDLVAEPTVFSPRFADWFGLRR